MEPIRAEYQDGVFKVSAGGVDVDFNYDELVGYVAEARQRAGEISWFDALCDVSRQIARACSKYMAGSVGVDDVSMTVLACLSQLFNTFLDKMIQVAYDVIDYGISLVRRFFTWLFGLFS